MINGNIALQYQTFSEHALFEHQPLSGVFKPWNFALTWVSGFLVQVYVIRLKKINEKSWKSSQLNYAISSA